MWTPFESIYDLDKPKSMRYRVTPSFPSRKFSGFKSRWMNIFLCKSDYEISKVLPSSLVRSCSDNFSEACKLNLPPHLESNYSKLSPK